MSEITTIGLDLAKHVFQVHGIDAQGTTVLRKRLLGHEVRLMPAQYVKAYTDMALGPSPTPERTLASASARVSPRP